MVRKKIIDDNMDISLKQLYKLYPNYKKYRQGRKGKSKYTFLEWLRR